MNSLANKIGSFVARCRTAFRILTGATSLAPEDYVTAKINEMTVDVQAKYEAAIEEIEVRAAEHAAAAARHDESTEHLKVLVNAGICKVKTRAAFFDLRN